MSPATSLAPEMASTGASATQHGGVPARAGAGAREPGAECAKWEQIAAAGREPAGAMQETCAPKAEAIVPTMQ